MDQLSVTRLINKSSHINKYLQNMFCQAYGFNFFSSQDSFCFQSIKILSDV